ncbi:MAG TPA: hypothetical protein VGP43_07370 [Chitinophagaceae bacterium]|nr:hypothetical protein [Chitinophagaceae bacterium]
MKFKFLFTLLYLTAAITNGQSFYQNFDKVNFYSVMSGGKLKEINNELKILNLTSIKEKEAYEGALLIRKAGVVKVAAEKIKLFKKGRIKLETALLNDNSNGEYHFLRLTIQENAPKIAKYKANIETDKQFIKKSFTNLPTDIQQVIIDYSKTSKILHPQDLKTDD